MRVVCLRGAREARRSRKRLEAGLASSLCAAGSPVDFKPADLLAARDAGIPIAFQTNTWLGADLGATCGGSLADTAACHDLGEGVPSILDLLNRGVCLGADYIEVFAADVGRYPKALAAGRKLPLGAVTCL